MQDSSKREDSEIRKKKINHTQQEEKSLIRANVKVKRFKSDIISRSLFLFKFCLAFWKNK